MNSKVSREGPKARPSHPELDWAVATNFAYLRDREWLPLLVEYDPIALTGEKPEERWQWFVDLKWLRGFGEDVIVPPLFTDLPHVLKTSSKFKYCVLLVRRSAVAKIIEGDEWRKTILRADLGPPFDVPVKDLKPLPSLPIKSPGDPVNRVVMGVIDQGIAFASRRFCRIDGSTRVAYLWQQDVLPDPGKTFTAGDIDLAVTNAKGDEEAVYRTIGGLNYSVDGFKPLGRLRAHGTQVLDLMAGADPDDDEQKRPIIAVDMPEQAVGDPSGSLLTAHAIWGLIYVLYYAEVLRTAGEKLPVVANLSYGPQEGPHDGTSLFEELADLVVDLYKDTSTPLTLVLAAGNFRQGRVHVRATIKPGVVEMLPWRLQPGSRSPSALQLWLDGNSEATITLRAPSGKAVSVPIPSATTSQSPASGLARFAAISSIVKGRATVTFNIAPTELDPTAASLHPVALSGRWTVEIYNSGSKDLTASGWIRRSDTQAGRRPKGRQSYFDDCNYLRFDSNGRPVPFDGPNPPSIVRRQCTLSGIATGNNTIVIGGYRRSELRPALYSSQGPHGSAKRPSNAPDWLEPSDDSIACRGMLAAGNRSGSVSTMNGTSAAAPQAARWLADLWVKDQKRPKPPPASFKPPIDDPLKPTPPGDKVPAIGKGLAPGLLRTIKRR